MSFTVLADPRWPEHTGIGQVYAEHLKRKPDEISTEILSISGRVAGPLAPLHIWNSLRQQRRSKFVFWNPGFVPPLEFTARSVVMVHDLSHLHHYGTPKRLYYETVLKPLYRRCASIICVSKSTRDEFLSWSGVNPATVEVVYNGVDARFSRTRTRNPDTPPYVFYPGNHRNYKNLDRLIRSFVRSCLPTRGVQLWLTGSPGPHLTNLIRSLDAGSSVRFLGRVPGEAMPQIYHDAMAVAFVSLYEGFGLPILESMAAGVPVLTSNISCMPEIAHNAALLVDPFDEDEISAGLEQIVFDNSLREELIRRGSIRVTEMSWDTFSTRLWERIQSVGHNN